MDFLLDTCTFLWIISNSSELSPKAREAYFSKESLYLSTVSTWEIAIKYQLKKLPIPALPDQYIPLQRERHDIISLALDEKSTLLLNKLPNFHQDPFDRMLICQALAHQLVIITPDKNMRQYPVETLW